MPDPAGYGRVIRSADGKVSKIVEQKDGTSQELAVNEVNAGIYCFELPELWELLHRIGNNNAQGEYYLTDIIGMLVADGKTVSAVAAEDYRETLGVNSRLQLAQAEKNFARTQTGRVNDRRRYGTGSVQYVCGNYGNGRARYGFICGHGLGRSNGNRREL